MKVKPRGLVAAAAVAGVAIVALTTQGADASTTTARGRAAGPPAAAYGLPAAWLKAGRWETLKGRRVWSVPLTLRVGRHGRPVAHVASTWSPSKLQNYGTGLCISSYPAYQGAHVHQYACNGSNNQSWRYLYDPGAAIFELWNYGDGYCMDNYQGRNATYNPQIMWDCGQGSAVPLAHSVGGSAVGGYLIHTSSAIGQWSGYCISSMGNQAEGSEVQLAVCNINAANQSWATSLPFS